jgi:phosphate/sulfate permease
MRAPNEFLKELINRNYRDKATPWWKEYKELIAMVVLIFVLGVTFFFLFYSLLKKTPLEKRKKLRKLKP